MSRVRRAGPSGRGRAVLLALSLLVVATALPAAAQLTVQGLPAWCPAEGALYADQLPARVDPAQCPMEGRLVIDHGVRVVVPPPGRAVLSEAILSDGSTQLLDIRAHPHGTVVLRHAGDDAAGHDAVGHEQADGADAAGGATGPARPACDDDAHSMTGYRDTSGYTWFFKSRTTPPGLSVGAVAQDLVDGYNAVTESLNDCGVADDVDALQRYGGNTEAPTGIDHTGACPAQGDGQYTVDFGNLPERILARTCWRGVQTAQGWFEISEADTKIRAGAGLFTGAVPADCGGTRFSVKAVMAHEIGHAFGLGHVAERDHGDLTMSQATPACSLAPHTLGLGDLRALQALY